ncbi:MAG TPA: hypothetical protein VID93_00480, partial [Acidimicrobiales bacterium]
MALNGDAVTVGQCREEVVDRRDRLPSGRPEQERPGDGVRARRGRGSLELGPVMAGDGQHEQEPG